MTPCLPKGKLAALLCVTLTVIVTWLREFQYLDMMNPLGQSTTTSNNTIMTGNTTNIAGIPKQGDSPGGVATSWTPTAWEPVYDRQWCKPISEDDEKLRNLIYLKISKTSSSTLSGINIRMAQQIGKEVLPDQQPCSHTYAHGRPFSGIRHPPYLLWTMLRDPGSRALSSYYHFEVSRNQQPADDERVLPHLAKARNSTFRLMRVDNGLNWTDYASNNQFQDGPIPDWFRIQRTIMEPYNFIGLVERRDESLAVMKLLWNMSISNFIVMSAKANGGYDDGVYKQTCFKIQKVPRPLPSTWSSYLSNGFRENNLDWVLYSMVNRTLDKTIESLGVENVKREVEQLQWLQELTERECSNRTILPCSANGKHQRASRKNCYWRDSGCGYKCVDEVMQRLGYMN